MCIRDRHGSQLLHFVVESRKRGRGRSELRNRLFYEQLRRFRFRRNTNVSAGFGVNRVRLCFTEVVALFPASMQVFACESSFGFLADAAAMPEFSHKIHPLFTPVPTDRA